MKITRRNLIIISLSVFLAATIFTVAFVTVIYRPTKLKQHSPIVIWGDEDFENYKFPGRGTKSNPYLIQNLNITSDIHELIFVTNTTKHFIIQNCYLKGLPTEIVSSGIVIENTADNTVKISENTIEIPYASPFWGGRGIRVENSSNILINNNKIISPSVSFYHNLDNFYSIIVRDSLGAKIENNEITDLICLNSPLLSLIENYASHSIRIWDSESSMIINNIVENEGYFVDNSENSTIVGNIITDSGEIILIDIRYSTVTNNQIINGGFKIADTNLTVENNFVNNKELGFFANQIDMTLISNQFGQIILINCTSSTIKNQEITNTTNAIDILTSTNITIEENILENNVNGISIFNSNSSNIVNNTCIDNSAGIGSVESTTLKILSNDLIDNSNGIHIFNSSLTDISNNTCINNGDGILTVYSTNLNILSNENYYNYYGISIHSLDSSTIINNTCNYNIREGLWIVTSSNLEIVNNTCNFNHKGILVEYSSNILVDGNTVSFNRLGIGVQWCLDMEIFNNEMYGVGLRFAYDGSPDSMLSYNVLNNTLDGKKIVYYKNMKNTSLPSETFGQVFLVNCSRFTIENQVFEGSNEFIEFNHCNEIFIRNSTFLNVSRALEFIFCEEVFVENTTFTNSSGEIVDFYNSKDCFILNNTFEKGGEFNLYLNSNFSIINNVFSELDQFRIFSNSNFTFANNSFIKNVHAITGHYIWYCTFKYNLFLQNEYYGINLGGYSGGNIIHHNAFIDNNLGGTSQARDVGPSISIWYDEISLEGNFWNDYVSGTYSIDGDAGSVDPYPLLTNPL